MRHLLHTIAAADWMGPPPVTALRLHRAIRKITGDNAGEIFFDRLLIERLPPGKVTVVVRGSPAINDAIMEDAEAAGIPEVAEVVDNSSDAPGTILEETSPEFRRVFEQADLIIAKGQGNYETLSACGKPIWFLLNVKCPLIANHIGEKMGSLVVKKNDLCG